MDVNSRQLVWRTHLLLRRAARDRRRSLIRELSAYRAEADRNDLMAAIERCPSPGSEEVRRLLLRTARRPDDELTSFHLHM
jgi:hypothetical protein